MSSKRPIQSAVQKYGSTRNYGNISKIIGEGVEATKLTPGTPEFRDAERELEYKNRQKKNRQDEIEVRGNRLLLGQNIAEGYHQQKKEIDDDIIELTKNEIIIAKCSRVNGNSEIQKDIISQDIDYDGLQNRLLAVTDILEINFADEFAWENNLPIFFKAFETWVNNNPEPDMIEEVSRKFCEIMDKARQVAEVSKMQKDFNEKKDQAIKKIDELLDFEDMMDDEIKICIEKAKEKLAVVKNFRFYNDGEVDYVKKNVRNALCEFLNIRNRVVKQEHLLMVIRNLPQDKLEIQNI